MIHPTAQISPTAQLGADVRVGPGVQIDAGCVIGAGCELRSHAVITGGAILGPGNQIGYGAVIGAEPQDLSFKGEPSRVILGERNVIREYVTIHRGAKQDTETRLGNENYLMVGCHVAHNCLIGNKVVIVNNVLLAGYVEVEDQAFLGGAAVIHQFVRIGRLAIIRGQTRIGKDLPPYFMATDTNEVSGLNRIGMRRAGLKEEARRQLQLAYKFLYQSGLNVTQALDKIESELRGEEIRYLLTFIRHSKRGICLARGANRSVGHPQLDQSET
jgi:UDP-N-acetylglucosamine acyltransferase